MCSCLDAIRIPSGAMYVYEMSGIFGRDDVSVENKRLRYSKLRDANLETPVPR